MAKDNFVATMFLLQVNPYLAIKCYLETMAEIIREKKGKAEKVDIKIAPEYIIDAFIDKILNNQKVLLNA